MVALRLVQAVSWLFLWLLCCLQQLEAATLAADKDALLAFRAGIWDDQGVLSNWDAGTDPCSDVWAGVSCDCADVFPALSAPACAAAEGDPLARRVLVLQFGAAANASSSSQGVLQSVGPAALVLAGQLAPELGQLSELRVLNMASNALQGSVPEALASLTQLRQLLLNDNQLSGALPAWAGSLPEAADVWLQNNRFNGSLPEAWCSAPGVRSRLHVDGNPDLCGPVPACLQARVVSYSGTALIRPGNPENLEGGTCISTGPACLLDQGCGTLMPQFWTNTSFIDYAFTAFNDTSGSALRYRFAIGTRPGAGDVASFQDFAGSNRTGSYSLVAGGPLWDNPVYYGSYAPQGRSLVSGQQYFLTVQALNSGGLRLSAIVISNGTLVDSTPPQLPQLAEVFNTDRYRFEQTQSSSKTFGVSWDPFVDLETNISSYAVQLFQYSTPSGGGELYGRAVSERVEVQLARSTRLTGLRLTIGASYFARVYAVNGAGLEGVADSPPLRIVFTSLSEAKLAGIIAGGVGLICVLVAACTLYIVRSRFHAASEERRAERGKHKIVKGLMYGLAHEVGDPGQKHLDEIRNSRELAFVITDLESSTAMAAVSGQAYGTIQDIHDMVMREGIAKHGGYEIATEGDAFQVAFMDAPHAVQFCMEVQARLMERNWPREVLRLAPCREVRAPGGELSFRGPRVRMGIHFAVEGTVAHRLHLLTKHRVFSGPGFQVAQEVGDAAHGGQVLMTHDAWVRLRGSMSAAGFPTVEQLGLFRLVHWPAHPMWIYQVKHLLGKPLHRAFPPPRGLAMVQAGWGLNIVPPPQPRALAGSPESLRLSFVALRVVRPSEAVAADLPAEVAKELYETVAVCAQQFGGYIFRLKQEKGRGMLAFASTLDAVRFCHAAQVAILYASWPAKDGADLYGATEAMPDGRLIFKGPRVATAIHETAEFKVAMLAGGGLLGEAADYSGPGEALAKKLCNITHGGQVLLSEPAWIAVQDQIPGQSQVISLGRHVVGQGPAQEMLLMEVMPTILMRRTFPPPRTLRMLEPGYRDSPDPANTMAIVFTKVAKPQEVVNAEQATSPVAEEEIVNAITAFNSSVDKAARVVRRLLPKYEGYECKEPEPGKFTLAFRDLESAVRWAVAVQKELLAVSWPGDLLEWPECAEEVDPVAGRTIWRGLRVRMGMAFGRPTYRKPLNTGRADYYGTLPNLAARVMALAAPGQVLLEGSWGLGGEVAWGRDDAVGFLPLARAASKDQHADGAETIQLGQLGYYLLKGLDDPKLIFQATASSLAGRRFDLPASAIRVTNLPRRLLAKGAGFPGGSFNSSDSRTASILLKASTTSKKALAGFFGVKREPVLDTSASAARHSSLQNLEPSPASELNSLRKSHNRNSMPGPSMLGPAIADARMGRGGALRHGPSQDFPGTPRAGLSRMPSYAGRERPAPLAIPHPRLTVSTDDETPRTNMGWKTPRRSTDGQAMERTLTRSGSTPSSRYAEARPRTPQRIASGLPHQHQPAASSEASSSLATTPRHGAGLPQPRQGRGKQPPPAALMRKSSSLIPSQWEMPSSSGSGAFGFQPGSPPADREPSGSEPSSSSAAPLDGHIKRLRVDVASSRAESVAAMDHLMTPGTVYAREVAQLFVAGRRHHSAASLAARPSAPSATSSGGAPSAPPSPPTAAAAASAASAAAGSGTGQSGVGGLRILPRHLRHSSEASRLGMGSAMGLVPDSPPSPATALDGRLHPEQLRRRISEVVPGWEDGTLPRPERRGSRPAAVTVAQRISTGIDEIQFSTPLGIVDGLEEENDFGLGSAEFSSGPTGGGRARGVFDYALELEQAMPLSEANAEHSPGGSEADTVPGLRRHGHARTAARLTAIVTRSGNSTPEVEISDISADILDTH